MFTVYVIYNKTTEKIYIGQTSNLQERIVAHNKKYGNHFTTKSQGKWELIYKESATTRSEALTREKQLKSYRGREFIKSHIPG